MKNKLLFSFLCFFIGVLFFCINSCKKSDTDPIVEEEVSPYAVKLTMDTLIHTYPGGGGIFVIHRGDSIEDLQDIDLKIVTDPSIKYKLSGNTLTKSSKIVEMELFPDSLIVPGKYKVNFICKYGSKTDTLKATVWHWKEKHLFSQI
jgi:hypothetical protein